MRLQSEHGRQTFAVGRSERDDEWVARFCGWCKEPFSAVDWMLKLYGAPISHGVCRSCKAQLKAEEEAES